MCGIAGFFDSNGFESRHGAELAIEMAAVLQHRGPDDGGVWVDGPAGVALGHRRLSIIDLTAAGHQPMTSHCGRFVIAFNGEVYNHGEIRREIEKRSTPIDWRGHSDTETLLEAVAAWGLAAAVARAVGMYSFAVWDRHERELTLVRDRLGEKPLYYGWIGSALVFGSELKAITAYPGFSSRIDRRVLSLYLQYNYVPSPWSIYEHVWKLPAGTSLSFSRSSARTRGEPKQYWSAKNVALEGISKPFRGDEEDAERELERLLRVSVAGQMEADVPVAAFLSGGIDSSTVVSVMQSLSSRPVRTFSIGFHEDTHNEAQYAAQVARHLGTEHQELYVAPGQALDVVPLLPDLYDEPFGDSSQVPTFLMTSLTRRHVAVALSGDGGDELFGGYNRYLWVQKIWSRVGVLPGSLRRLGSTIVRSIPTHGWDSLFRIGSFAIPKRLRYSSPGDKLHKLATVLSSQDAADIYRQLVSLRWPESTVLGASGTRDVAISDPAMWLQDVGLVDRMMLLDLVTYLADDILVKVDRAAMGTSLETRVPLLDHRLVEFAWTLPWTMKIRSGEGKYLLKRLLHRFVPRRLVDRPKMGFGVPIDTWLRGPLRDWAETLLSRSALQRQGYLNADTIRLRWDQHLSGSASWHYDLWCVLMFQAWLERWVDRPARAPHRMNRASMKVETATPSLRWQMPARVGIPL